MSGIQPREIDLSTVDLRSFHERVGNRGQLGVCWPWRGGHGSNGYGLVSRGKKLSRYLAHRVAYTVAFGAIPDGLHIDHLCRNRECVNPAHLEPVTNRVNGLRGMSPSALHARQTHCVNGHEFTHENTIITTRGTRKCRECARISDRQRPSGWARQRASAEGKQA